MLEQQISQAFLEAYKAKDEKAVGTLRMIKSAILNKKIEKKMAKDDLLPDDDAMAVLKSEVKKRLDSIEAYKAGNRADLAAIEQGEVEIISKFLPEQLSEDKIRELVKEAIAEAGNPGPASFGKIMGLVVAKAKGAADGSVVSKIVKEELSA